MQVDPPPCDLQTIRPSPPPVPPPPAVESPKVVFRLDSARIDTSTNGSAPHVQLMEPAADGVATDLAGVSMLWDKLAHRTSTAHVAVTNRSDGSTPEVDVRMVGGTWSTGAMASDNNTVQIRTASVTAPGAVLLPGEITVRALSDKDHGKAPAVVTGTVRIPASQVPPGSAVAVTLNGYSIETTPSHPEGSTIAGMSARLHDARLEGEELVFDFETGIVGRPTPDRPSQHLGKGFDVDLRLGFTAWVVPGGAATAQTGTTSGKRPLTMHTGPATLPVQESPVRISGKPGLAGGHLGLSGFAIDLQGRGPWGGRYVRGYEFGVSQGDYDPATGTVTGTNRAGYVNTSEIGRPTAYDVTLDTVLIQSPLPITHTEGQVTKRGMP